MLFVNVRLCCCSSMCSCQTALYFPRLFVTVVANLFAIAATVSAVVKPFPFTAPTVPSAVSVVNPASVPAAVVRLFHQIQHGGGTLEVIEDVQHPLSLKQINSGLQDVLNLSEEVKR